MKLKNRKTLLRANALFLLVASGGGFLADILGTFLAIGPQSGLMGGAPPYASIGMFEAHGLAFIVGILLWNAKPERPWHLTAGAVHLLLGLCNLTFWQGFVAADALWLGIVTTSLHGLFAVTQLIAAGPDGKTARHPWSGGGIRHRGAMPARVIEIK